MTKYVEGTFIVPVDLEMKKFFESLGYKECRITELISEECKPFLSISEPTTLKFYERYQYSKTKDTNESLD